MTVSETTLDQDLGYQDRILEGVSRTFALTIPQLPQPLQVAVGNAYLLCRIADTIEDEPALSRSEKRKFSTRFVNVVSGQEDPQRFADDAQGALSPKTGAHERDLVANTTRVLNVSASLPLDQKRAMARCVRIMIVGMVDFQENASRRGLEDLEDFDRYCYHVAGVVGEMLTELFCGYSPEMNARRVELLALGRSFGQALQMTNILKDVWEDYSRGVCWLPRRIFRRHGVELGAVSPGERDPGFVAAMNDLVSIARHHLDNALHYVRIIPAHEPGVRRFCMWALVLAVLTLRQIYRTPGFSSGREVTISRREVRLATGLSGILVRSDKALALLIAILSRGLPPARPGPEAGAR